MENTNQHKIDLYRYIMSQLSYKITENKDLILESKNFKKAKSLLDNDDVFEGDSTEFIKNVIIPNVPSLRTAKGSKFIIGVVRIFIEDGFIVPELRKSQEKFFIMFNKIIQSISDYEYDYYSRNLNGLSSSELFYKYIPIFRNKELKVRYILSSKSKKLVRNDDYTK